MKDFNRFDGCNNDIKLLELIHNHRIHNLVLGFKYHRKHVSASIQFFGNNPLIIKIKTIMLITGI